MDCYWQQEINYIKEQKIKVKLRDEDIIKLLELAKNFDVENFDGNVQPMDIFVNYERRKVNIFGIEYSWDSLFGCNPSMENYFYVLSAQNGGSVSKISRVLFYKTIVNQVIDIFHKVATKELNEFFQNMKM